MKFTTTALLSIAAPFAAGFSSSSFIGSSVSSGNNIRNKNGLVMKDFPKPNVEDTDNYRNFEALSTSFKTSLKADTSEKKKVAIIGGGLSGLACAKYLVDAGHEPTVSAIWKFAVFRCVLC